MSDQRDDAPQGSPWDLYGGTTGFRDMLLSIAALALGGVIAVVGLGLPITDILFGTMLAGLLLLAPFPLLAGDATDALLLAAGRRGWLSVEAYRRVAPVLVHGALLVVGMAAYPIVLAIGGIDLLGVFVVVGAFVLFGALPIGGWLVRKLRQSRPGS